VSVQRWCVRHGAWVDQAQAAIVGVEAGSGPGLPAWACLDCLQDRGGQQDVEGACVAPMPSGDAA
jgi:hypothetical protein